MLLRDLASEDHANLKLWQLGLDLGESVVIDQPGMSASDPRRLGARFVFLRPTLFDGSSYPIGSPTRVWRYRKQPAVLFDIGALFSP
ncbi:hypothetical protein D3C75_1230210 [compost metagenome]